MEQPGGTGGGDNDWGPSMFGMSFEDMLTAPGGNVFGYKVLSFHLGNLRVLSSNEIDCVHPEDGLSIELKSVKATTACQEERRISSQEST